MTRCDQTDLHPEECAHCRGDEAPDIKPGAPRRFTPAATGRVVWPEPQVPYVRPTIAAVEPATDDPIVKVARDLRAIRAMAPLLDDRGEDLATAVEMPGGDATATTSPVASPSTWQRRYDLAEEAWATAHAAGTAGEDDRPSTADESAWEPPLQTLLFWSEDWRHRLGMMHELWLPTLDTEANFLAAGDVLAWARDHEHRWDDYAADVAAVRTRLENIVRSGIRTTRSRIVCDKPHPDKPHKKLTLVYGQGDEAAGYIAPCCHARYTPEEAKRAHARQMRSQGADRFVTTTEAVAVLAVQGWQRRTVRRWIEPLRAVDRCAECGRTWPEREYPACPDKFYVNGEVVECGGLLVRVWRGDRNQVPESYCDVATRRTLVRWPDLWRRHLTARHEREQAG